MRSFVLKFLIISVFLILTPINVFAWDPITGGDHGGANWTISSNQDIGGTHTNVGTFTINAGTTASVKAYNGTANGKLEIHANNVNIIGTLDAVGKGYSGAYSSTAPGAGPGGGLGCGGGTNGNGASYGGYGSRVCNSANPVALYGQAILPLDMGSGGSGGYNTGLGGTGGGYVNVQVGNTLSITGSILANGGNAVNNGGGGSGGGILLDTNTLIGNGLVSTNGGSNPNNTGGGAGGGRIAIKYINSSTSTITFTANVGTGITGATIIQPTAGTIVFIDKSTNNLYVKNSQYWYAGPNADGSIVNFNSINISNNSSLTLKGYTSSATEGTGFEFKVQDFSIESGSSINMVGMGFTGAPNHGTNGGGPGGGKGGGLGGNGGGAGYGGVGGNISTGYGLVYGTSANPIYLGSGGGGGYSNVPGVAGGGSLKINGTGTISINGPITADGVGTTTNGGCGSGGSIYIVGGLIQGNGALSANGGSSSGNGGGGGGGRIAIYYSQTNNYAGVMTVTAGTGSGTAAGNGSTYTSGYPSLPSSLTQYNQALSQQIAQAGTASTSTVNLRFNVSHADVMRLTPQVEIRDIGTSFTDVATNIGTTVSYTNTPVLATVPVTNLVDKTSYHWQARVCDVNDQCSNWVSYGTNTESQADFSTFFNQNPNAPTSPGPTYYTDGSWTSTVSPSLTFTLTDPDASDQLKYQIEIATDSGFNNLVINYISSLQTQGARTFIVGTTNEPGSTYSTGSSSTVLTANNYFWRVKTIDQSDAESSWTTVGSVTPAFKVDTSTPSQNASNLTVSGQLSTDWVNSKPTISWTAGTDSNSGILGYCISMGEVNIGDAAPTLDPKVTSGIFSDFDDGQSTDYCPYMITATSINLGNTAPSNPLKDVIYTSGKQYYFSVKAVNRAGNVYTNSDTITYLNLATFKYDSTPPSNVSSVSTPGGNFSNLDDVYFNFPTSGDIAATDSGSGLLGFQYALNNQTTWIGSTTDPELNLSYISLGVTQPFHLDSSKVSSQLKVGYNTIYFRVLDKVGNVSTVIRSAAFSYGGQAPSFPDSSTIDVTTIDVGTTKPRNLFTIKWAAATPSSGKHVSKYYYMVNTTPPSSYATLSSNPSTYIPITTNQIVDTPLPNIQRGDNTFTVVAVDDNTDINGALAPNYSPSSALSTTVEFNSSLPDAPVNLAVSDASIKEASLWRASIAWQTPVYTGTGGVIYTIQRSTNGTTWTTIGTTSGNAYLDTVSTSSKYYWRVGTSDTTLDSLASPSYSAGAYITPRGKYTSAAGLSSGPDSSSLTTRKATITWTTDRKSDSKISFGIESGKYNSEEISSSEQVSSHSIKLTNLLPGTTYYYVAKWTDEDGNTGNSAEKSFTTQPSPSITDIKAIDTGISSTLIKFTSQAATKIKIYYGISTDFGGSREIITSTEFSDYTIKLDNLLDGTKYFYKLNGFDSEGVEYDTGVVISFETLPRPKVSNVQIQQVPGTAQSTLLITWKSNTDISSIITYYPSVNPADSRDEVDIKMIKGDHKILLKGLIPDTVYSLVVRGRDKMGNEAVSERYTFTTATDTRPPITYDMSVEGTNIPAVNTTGQDSTSQLVVSWTTDEPSTSQVEYGEGSNTSYQQKTQEDTNLTFNHIVIISGLTPSKVYHLRALSKDKASNLGTSIDTVTITPKATDNALNLVITNLSEAFGFLGKIK